MPGKRNTTGETTSPILLIASVFKWNRGGELNSEKQDPLGSSLRWSLGTACHPLAVSHDHMPEPNNFHLLRQTTPPIIGVAAYRFK